MTTFSFSDVFQSRVNAEGTVKFSIEDLEASFSNASLGQLPIKPTSLSKIVKSIVDKRQMWSPLKIAYTPDGMYYLISGRHRFTSIKEITSNYGINLLNELTKINEANKADLSPITGEVQCYVVRCNSVQEVSELILSENGSRSVVDAERILIESVGGDTSKLELLDYASQFAKSVTRTFLTPTTSLAMIKGALAKTPNGRYATPEQMVAIFNSLADYINDEDMELPKNISYDQAKVVKAWAGLPESYFKISVPVKIKKATKEEIALAERAALSAQIKAELQESITAAVKAKMTDAFGLDPNAVQAI